ncbi:hypothetical protein OG898_34035 [Streptomyces sp. NBC_00193]|uniref:hypothetical protein n=1 Tax=unclassified Streptomyces TaxID=2593676 RepID=UPI002252F2AD|nr:MULTISPECIES: hypothetical protein [unclassified Streptomyces]MCX5127905.1 hypothetical protein [Streptomyces sp. NBC_00347]MCX5301428.1 hypothetical protein [Streptomyces sp. NBC_00193]
MNVLVDFARTGRIGPLRCGMPLAEADDLLGPGRPHPAIQLIPDIEGYPYAWDCLELSVTRRLVSGISISLRPGSTTRLPSLVLPDSEAYPSTVLREDLLAALDAVDCRHDVNDRLTFGGQSSILTHPANVCAVFFTPHRDEQVPHRERLYLGAIHKHATASDADARA